MRADTFNILVGVDFSESSAGVLERALRLAERTGAVLHLVHITPAVKHLAAPMDLELNIPEEFSEARHARERLEGLRVMMGAKVPVEVHVRMGDAGPGLLQFIRELQPDMVLVGSHGHGAVMQFLAGSVCTQLTRLSPVPVLVIPDPRRQTLAAKDTPAQVEPPLPSVAEPSGEMLDMSRINTASSGSVSVCPSGTNGYSLNPELRIRY